MPIRPADHGIFASAAGGIAYGAYFAGGYEAANVATIDKFAFSNDARTTLGTALSSARTGVQGAANSGVAAYFAGNNTTVDKLAFSDDSRTTLGTGLSQSTEKAGCGELGDSRLFRWWLLRGVLHSCKQVRVLR